MKSLVRWHSEGGEGVVKRERSVRRRLPILRVVVVATPLCRDLGSEPDKEQHKHEDWATRHYRGESPLARLIARNLLFE